MKAPLPSDEAERLSDLRTFDVLDTPPEPEFDDLTRLAASICGAPIALISLLDPYRQWFKSRVGLDVAETHRDIAFCTHAILQNDLYIVPDAAEAAQFRDNPLVTSEPHIRFYAGMPLTTPEGHNLGTLCIIDRVPRILTAVQQDALRVLGRQVVAQLLLRRQMKRLTDELTERKKVEADLRKSDRKFRAIFDTMFEFIGLLSPDGTILDVNRTALDSVGVTLADVVGRPAPDTIWCRHDPKTQDRLRDAIRRAANGEFVRFEMTVPIVDGTLATLDFSIQPVYDENGNVVLLVAEGRDVTARKQMEDALRASEERFRAFMDNSPAVAFMKDEAGRMVYVNEPLIRRFGLPRERWLGHTDTELWPEDVARTLQETDRKIMASEETLALYETVWTPDGDTSVWHSFKFPFTDAAGKRYLAGMAVDRTKEKMAEEALRQSEERFRSVVEELAEGVVLLDRESRSVLRSNRAFLNLLGYAPDELAALTQYDFVADDEHDLDSKMMSIESRQRASLGFCKYRRKDGSAVDVSVSGSVLTLDGRAVFCLVVQDRTEQIRVENALRSSEAKFRNTVDRLAEGVFVVDVATRTFVDANAALLTLLGFTLREFVALDIFDIVAGETREFFTQNVKQMDEKLTQLGRCDLGRHRLRRRDGSVVQVELRVTVVPDGGQGLHAVIVRDVTEQVEYEND